MRSVQTRGFFELTWNIFRFCMKSIFGVLAIVSVVGTIIFVFPSSEFSSLPAPQFLASLASALLGGLVLVSYATLILAVPVSAFCAAIALLATAMNRLTELLFPKGDIVRFEWESDVEEPPAPD
ncbi:MAG: hypothetical protein HY815_02410, partial [Candidatus Riflebacteria bacterium]|nr:hypothetical protein [Candidatus Riflebacteria bacterium]